MRRKGKLKGGRSFKVKSHKTNGLDFSILEYFKLNFNARYSPSNEPIRCTARSTATAISTYSLSQKVGTLSRNHGTQYSGVCKIYAHCFQNIRPPFAKTTINTSAH